MMKMWQQTFSSSGAFLREEGRACWGHVPGARLGVFNRRKKRGTLVL